MNKIIILLSLSLFSSFSFAEGNLNQKLNDAKPITALTENKTATITISGMHCGGCKKMVTKKVCEEASLSTDFESCSITNLDTKNQIGTLVLKYKTNTKMDLDKVEKAISAAGEDYKVTKKEISK